MKETIELHLERGIFLGRVVISELGDDPLLWLDALVPSHAMSLGVASGYEFQ